MRPLVAIEPIARERRETLERLFQLYAHDFSALVPLPLREDGGFDVRVGDEWFGAPQHYPFFIRRAGALVGFALVRHGSRVVAGRGVMDVAEFFVVRGARRARVGMDAIAALFARFPGAWEIRVRQSNPAALAFWQTVATPRTTFERDGVSWCLLTHESPQLPP